MSRRPEAWFATAAALAIHGSLTDHDDGPESPSPNPGPAGKPLQAWAARLDGDGWVLEMGMDGMSLSLQLRPDHVGLTGRIGFLARAMLTSSPQIWSPGNDGPGP